MRAKLYMNQMKIGGSATEYIRQVQNSRHIPVNQTGEREKAEALGILESFEDCNNPPDDVDIGIITGKDVNRQLESDLLDFKVLPYFFSDLARSQGEGIAEGDAVSLLGDDRSFEVVHVSHESESVHLRDSDGNGYLVPWQLVQPWRE